MVGCEGRKLLIAPQHPRKTKHGLESLLHGISESLNSAGRALILVSQQNKNGLKSQVPVSQRDENGLERQLWVSQEGYVWFKEHTPWYLKD